MKRRVNKTLKISLNSEASGYLKKILQELKSGQCPVKINLSQFVSWVVVSFFENRFQREREAIRLNFIDRRRWLQNLLENADNGELEQVLKNVLKAIRHWSKQGKANSPSVVWGEDEVESEEVPRCECCGEYLYNGPICPNCSMYF